MSSGDLKNPLAMIEINSKVNLKPLFIIVFFLSFLCSFLGILVPFLVIVFFVSLPFYVRRKSLIGFAFLGQLLILPMFAGTMLAEFLKRIFF